MARRVQNRNPRTTAWEYKLLTVGNPLEPDTELRANVVGKLGWELVTIDAGVWVFKRPLAQEAAAALLPEAIEETVPLTDHDLVPAVAAPARVTGAVLPVLEP